MPDQSWWRRLDDRLADRFGVLLVLVVATIGCQALIDVRGSALGGLITHAISGLALVVAVRAGVAPRRLRRIADLLVLATLTTNLVYLGAVTVADRPAPKVGGELLWLVAAAIVPVVVANRLARHTEVRVQTVMGAVAAYLQIAVAYASLYQFLDVLTPGPFFGTDEPSTAYTYASLQSITTLGLGDLVSPHALARLAMVSEAVLGQVFLVTFVALIVTRFATPESRDGPGSEAS